MTRYTGVLSPQIDILAEAYAECGLVDEDSLVCWFLSLHDAVFPPLQICCLTYWFFRCSLEVSLVYLLEYSVASSGCKLQG